MNLHNLFESANSRPNFVVGDPVIITGDVEFRGKTGDVREFDRDGSFVVVNLYNYGPRSFHVSDVSYNDYADAEDVAEGDRPGMKDGRPYSDPLRRHPGNDSYMTPEYLIQKYQDELKKIAAGPYKRPKDVAMYQARIAKLQRQQGVAEGYDSEELANEVYAEFERMYPNLARRADERTVHAAVMDVLNYGGDSDPAALAQDVARAVKKDTQGVAEGGVLKSIKRGLQGWSGDTDLAITGKRNKPKDVVQRTKGYDTDTLKSLSKNSTPAKGSPAALQQKVISRELKKRGEPGVAEATGDEKFDKMLKGVTSKKSVAKQQKTDTEQQARDAFGGMFGGGNPADKLGIRPKGVAEESESGDGSVKPISVGDNVTYRGRPATVVALSHAKTVAKITLKGGAVVKHVMTKDLKQIDRGTPMGSLAEKAERAEKNDQPWVDPKLKRRMDYAFGHYAGYRDKPEAFFKWVMNSIDHSEQTDQQHDERFDRIEREIEQLSQRLSQVNEQHGAAVANRFSQRLVEHFELDRPTADPTRSVFVESRAAKRAAIREIFARQG
jgi:hypothetical protein